MILSINIVIHSHKLSLLSVRVYSTSSLSWSLASSLTFDDCVSSVSAKQAIESLSLSPSLSISPPYGNVFPEVRPEFFWFVLKEIKKIQPFGCQVR
jgi:hypothetical protein